jgi:hypothetical protein
VTGWLVEEILGEIKGPNDGFEVARFEFFSSSEWKGEGYLMPVDVGVANRAGASFAVIDVLFKQRIVRPEALPDVAVFERPGH